MYCVICSRTHFKSNLPNTGYMLVSNAAWTDAFGGHHNLAWFYLTTTWGEKPNISLCIYVHDEYL